MVRIAFTAILLFGASAFAQVTDFNNNNNFNNGIAQGVNGAAQGVNGAAQGGNGAAQGGNDAAQGGGGNDPAQARVGKGDGSQFITGPCASKADCASQCCTQRNGKVECAAPGALGVDVNDEKCNAVA